LVYAVTGPTFKGHFITIARLCLLALLDCMDEIGRRSTSNTLALLIRGEFSGGLARHRIIRDATRLLVQSIAL
jgi:hypothetical protein